MLQQPNYNHARCTTHVLILLPLGLFVILTFKIKWNTGIKQNWKDTMNLTEFLKTVFNPYTQLKGEVKMSWVKKQQQNCTNSMWIIQNEQK